MANATGNFMLDKGYDVKEPVEQYKFCMVDEEGVFPVTSDSDMPLGVPQFHVTESEMARGKGASVRLQGISELYVGSDANDPAPGLTAYLSSDNDGSVTDASGGTVVGVFQGVGIAGGRASVEINIERS